MNLKQRFICQSFHTPWDTIRGSSCDIRCTRYQVQWIERDAGILYQVKIYYKDKFQDM
jgi:hypothetical protein